MADKKKDKKKDKVNMRDLKPKKDAKGGGTQQAQTLPPHGRIQ